MYTVEAIKFCGLLCGWSYNTCVSITMADTVVQSIEGWMAQKCKEINSVFKVLQKALATRQEALLEECDRIAIDLVEGMKAVLEDDIIVTSLDQTVLVSAISQFGASSYKSKKPDPCITIGG